MRNIDQTSAELFDKLRNRFSPIDIRDEERKKTLDPDKARFFSFNYVSDGEDLGPITISLLNRSLKIFYSTDIDAKMNPMQKRKWFKFLKDLRFFAMPEVKDFDVRDISKSGLNLHDLKYLNKDSDVFSKNEIGVNESKLYGTSRSSYQQLENVRIIARHSKPIVDETVPGARSRNIESFYIENSQGERFKLPEGTTINGARAYARHVKNGGALHDDFSKHIGRMIKEMTDMRMFVRNMRGRTFEDIQTQQMVESAIDHYGKLHRDLHLIRSQRGYDQYKKLWQPEFIDEDYYDLGELRERFVRKVFDERMDDALPVVFREYRRRKMAAEQEFESWAGEMVREFEEKNPTDQHNKKAAKNNLDLEEEHLSEINVKSPFANSLHNQERDSTDTTVPGNENQNLAGLLNEKGFEFRFDDGIYYFESRAEVERAKDWISYKFPSMKFPKMGIYDYGYGVYGSTTFDRELPGGKGVMESINEDLRKWFKEKWVRFGPDGKIRGDCARGDDSEGKPKCLPRAKAHALGKKGRKTAASRKRREDPNPERSGPAINVKTKESQHNNLSEFAPSGGEGNGPFDYGRAIVEIGHEFVDYYQDEGAQADAKAIIKVGQTFISAGMKSGIQAFYNLDTQIRDHVAEQLMEQGFNVKEDIYLPHKQQMATATANDAAELEKYKSSPEYAARRADDLTISAIPDKPINSWSKPGEPAASVTMDRASKRNIKAEFEKFKQDLALRDSLKNVQLRFEITVGGKPINIANLKEQGIAESPIQWHNTETGVKDAAQTDHTMDEALEYLKTNYPVVKMYNVRRATMGLTALDQPKYVDTGNEADINKNIIRKSAAHMSGVDSAVDYLQLRKNNMMSGSQQVTLTIGYSWSVYENPNSGIAMLYYQDRGMAWDEIYLAGKTAKIQAQARQVFRDAGVLPTPMKKPKQQDIAEATGDAKFDNMMTKMVKGASARKDIDTLRAQPIKASPEATLAKFGMELIAQLEKLCRARCGTNRTMQDKPDIEPKLTAMSNSNDGGEKVANILLDLYKIDSNALQEFARAFNQHGDWPWQNFAIAWTQGEWADYKRQWMDYIGNLGKGVAEGFTDDLDNIYAMHPQPEQSEQVVFLITGMTEDEFADRWTDLPDPYQQEFGYDLPLWDADDLSSYPNLTVKRITFDQYVRLVGNYIKSEEIGGSTLSKMKRGMTEGPLQEFAPGSGGGDGRWYTDDEIADIIGEDWFEFDLSGEAANISIHGEHAKILLVQEAQAYFEDRGYHGVVVQDVRDDEDFLSWYISGNFTRSDEGVAEGKKPDRYHIVGKDGKPVNLASYADEASAIKDRDAKYPGAVVQRVGPRGKVKGVAEQAQICSECGGPSYSNPMLAEKKDACYHKVKSRYKVWPSAYASGALVKCRKKGAKNWGNKSESKLDPAAKILESFKADLNKF